MTLRNSHSSLVYLLLGLVLLAGLALRTWNVNFDGGLNAHPDERSTACFYAPSIGWPASFAQFQDPQRSPLNPLWDRQNDRRRSFTYGHFPLYLGILTGELLADLTPVGKALPLSQETVSQMERANTACAGVTVAGRLLMALLDTLTIFFLFLLGRRLYGPWPGLLAATLYAFTAQAIQLAHFFAMDPASTTFTVLAVYGGVLMVQDRSWRGVLLAGIGAGLAVSSKFSALPILAVPVVAAGIVLWQDARGEETVRGKGSLAMLLGAPVALLLAFVAFFITSPYAVLDWENFVQATLVEQGQMVRGIADMPFTRQYRNTTPYLYFIEQQVVWGMGLPLGLLALAGSVWALGKVVLPRARPGELIVWTWLVPYFGLTGAFLAKFNRYMSPVLPFVLLFAAGLIAWLWGLSTQRRQEAESAEAATAPAPNPVSRAAAVLLAAIGIGGGLFWSLAYVNGVYNREHTWIAASRWVYENVPEGSVILWELWDDPLPKGIPGEPGMDMGSQGLRHIDWSPYEEDTPEKYELLKQKLREADYVIYSSKRIYDSVDELPERYPLTTRYYDLMFAEELGFAHVADFTSPPRLFGLTFPDQNADESWSLYDHPRASVFAKQRDLSDAEFDALLGGAWEGAIPWYRGKDSPISPFLNALGLGSSPESQDSGLINRLIALLRGEELPAAPPPGPEERKDLSLDTPLDELPLVDDYRWNVAASESPWLAVGWWWLVISLLGWAAWPLAFVLFRRLRDRGYLLAKTLGWLLAGWLLWLFASFGLAHNTVTNAWLTVLLLALLGGIALAWSWREFWPFLRRMWGLLLVGEALFAGAYVLFVFIRMGNPDIWQPWFGGEKFMEFAFLNGILRSPTFPPVDPHFAGGYINYYYYGIYLVGYLIKLTGIYAEVAFNLAIPTLFALTVVNAFGVAYSAVPARPVRSQEPDDLPAGAMHVYAMRLPVFETDEPEEAQPPAPRPQSDLPEDDLPEDDLLEIDLSPSRTARPQEPAPPRPAPAPAPTPAPAAESAAAPAAPQFERLDDEPTEPDLPIVPRLQAASRRILARPWQEGIGAALLAPLFVALIGNLDSFAQIVRRLVELSTSSFESALPPIETTVHALSGLARLLTTEAALPGYDFWAPSRVIPFTINEFPYWSFTFADLHPHMIGIPFSVFFLGLVLALLNSYDVDWRRQWGYGLLLLGGFAFTLGVLANVNLWELPTYFGLGVLAFAVALFRGRGRLPLLLLAGASGLYLAGTYLLFLPFFRSYTNVAASGVGLVRAPDEPGTWLLIWGFFGFVLASWLLLELLRPARRGDRPPTGLERAFGLIGSRFARLPRFLQLHRLLVQRPAVLYLLGLLLLPALVGVALLLLIFSQRTVLALCLPLLGVGFLLLWRRGRAADAGAQAGALFAVTGLAILAGTQVVYLKDFLQGGDWYRMNTLFKFFIQVWVLWGVAAAIAVPRIFRAFAGRSAQSPAPAAQSPNSRSSIATALRPVWTAAFALLLLASLAYPLWGTPARLDQRFPGWRPEIGTLDGMAFMQEGVYFWPDGNNPIELQYDWEAIRWLLENVQGNVVVAESAQVEYYRAGGTRVASLTGLSGLTGMHEGEQRYGELVGERSGRLNEFWNTPDTGRMQQLIAELGIGLVYVGQLERHQHPDAVQRLAQLAASGALQTVYANEKVTIYAVPSQIIRTPDGSIAPQPG